MSYHHYTASRITGTMTSTSSEKSFGGLTGAPCGETVEAKKCCYLALVIREYGYESSSNRGTSIYDDLGDFSHGRYEFTKEHRDTVLEYFKTRKPELYEKYMDGVAFYLGGI
jgi:hypothetical protein